MTHQVSAFWPTPSGSAISADSPIISADRDGTAGTDQIGTTYAYNALRRQYWSSPDVTGGGWVVRVFDRYRIEVDSYLAFDEPAVGDVVVGQLHHWLIAKIMIKKVVEGEIWIRASMVPPNLVAGAR